MRHTTGPRPRHISTRFRLTCSPRTSTDPEVLGTITAPTLVLQGQQTALGTFIPDAARHVYQHVPDSHVRELAAVGHFAPLLAPERVAGELINFLAAVRQEPAWQPV
jgi:pimeloyl-ACP methyl ester carboxylesterase